MAVYIIVLNSPENEAIHKTRCISSFLLIHDTHNDVLRDSIGCLAAELVCTYSAWTESCLGPMKVNSPRAY